TWPAPSILPSMVSSAAITDSLVSPSGTRRGNAKLGGRSMRPSTSFSFSFLGVASSGFGANSVFAGAGVCSFQMAMARASCLSGRRCENRWWRVARSTRVTTWACSCTDLLISPPEELDRHLRSYPKIVKCRFLVLGGRAQAAMSRNRTASPVPTVRPRDRLLRGGGEGPVDVGERNGAGQTGEGPLLGDFLRCLEEPGPGRAGQGAADADPPNARQRQLGHGGEVTA